MPVNIPDRNRIIEATLQFIDDQVKDSIQSTDDDIIKIRADVENMRFMIANMRNDIIEVVLRHERPIQSKPRHLLPDPTYLKDAKHENFGLWKIEVLTKLRVDGRAIGSEKDQFEYVLSRLAPKYNNHVKSILQPREIDENWDVNLIFDVLGDMIVDNEIAENPLWEL